MDSQLQTTSVNLYQPAILKVEGVDELEKEIKRLSQEMQNTTVTEDNLQHYKKLLAEIRKKWGLVDRQRIDIKKEVLAPYLEFETLIKDIKAELDKGERHIADQLNAIRERERLERYAELKELYESYLEAYKAPHWLYFETFIIGRETLFTNSSTSKRKKIDAITSFFEEYNNDYQTLKENYPFEDDRTAILLSYSANGFDMPLAISAFEAMKAEKERLRKLQEEKGKKVKISFDKKPEAKPKVKKVLVEIDEKYLTQLDNNGIIYKVIKK